MAILDRASSAPELQPEGTWFNSPPFDTGDLAGRVALVNFWVHSCGNCHASLPTLRTWRERYAVDAFEIVGVHTPEFASDRDPDALARSIARDGVSWPVLQDNGYATWRAWDVQAWPTFFLLDREGGIRDRHVGELSARFPAGIAPLQRRIEELIAE